MHPKEFAKMFSLFVAVAVLRKSCLTTGMTVTQAHRILSVKLGDPVTLECYTQVDKVTRWLWLKKKPGQAPEMIISTYYEQMELHGELTGGMNTSVLLRKDSRSMNVTLLSVRLSDIAVYYCAFSDYEHYKFGAGTFLSVTAYDCCMKNIVQRPVSGTVQPGDSVSLQCTVETGSCAGEHSVYWFRHGSGESLPGDIYTHGNRSDECEKSPEAGSPTRSCVYSLPKRNLSLSDAGTYYCAVAMCGEILFGNGTKLEITGSRWNDPLVISLATLNACFLIVIVVQLGKMYGCFSGSLEDSRPKPCENEPQDIEPSYASLNFKRSKYITGRQRGEKKINCTYSEVIFQQNDEQHLQKD
ncbi:uncharacterized protein LOC125750743 [Brienomyrus brachyistius]|uniref:uncharacterized protein LOC125750743 n=1 Tax=Brienomyrus brachyistius TaxID=42636 RepID=UPI0020B426BF|nr:uncharacterized protein LOC125750743 [Brienomyrus brachyistius]